MKRIVAVSALAIALAFGFWLGSRLRTAEAQTAIPLQMIVSGAKASCTVTPGATTFCFAADGLWESINGAAYTRVGGGTAGVTSFNGRSGAVVATPGDYNYSQISNPPTTINCGVTGCTIR